MSLADELLNSMTNDEIEAYAETEQPIIISEDRTVVVPEDLKRIAVQFDHNVETVSFICPRYWDGLDMSQMNVYINYTRSDNHTNVYQTEVFSADDTNMYFSWTVSNDVTQVKGEIAFLVCVKKVENNEEVIHWNSELCRDCYISEGLETEASIAEQYPDVIMQLSDRVNELEQSTDLTISANIVNGVLCLFREAET